MIYNPLFTPILGRDGTVLIALDPACIPLTSYVTIPPEARGAWITANAEQDDDHLLFGFRLDGQITGGGDPRMEWRGLQHLELTSRAQLEAFTIGQSLNFLTATFAVVQFFKGQTGTRR